MNVYTDPSLLDVAGALEALPVLPVKGQPSHDARHLQAGVCKDPPSRRNSPIPLRVL
ncbi:MAG: hypothetical protein R6X33_08050 [Candidatus Brocadiia bacterium]